MNLQVTILKVLASYPNGIATFDALKRDLEYLASRGRDWSDRTRRLAAHLPGAEYFLDGIGRTAPSRLATHQQGAIRTPVYGRMGRQPPTRTIPTLEGGRHARTSAPGPFATVAAQRHARSALAHHRAGCLFQLKSGLTSAPLRSHRVRRSHYSI